jgi:hypothetical protein
MKTLSSPKSLALLPKFLEFIFKVDGICNSTKIKKIIMLSLVIAMLVVLIFGIVIEIGTICVCGCVMK